MCGKQKENDRSDVKGPNVDRGEMIAEAKERHSQSLWKFIEIMISSLPKVV